jgi:hypothetical protein
VGLLLSNAVTLLLENIRHTTSTAEDIGNNWDDSVINYQLQRFGRLGCSVLRGTTSAIAWQCRRKPLNVLQEHFQTYVFMYSASMVRGGLRLGRFFQTASHSFVAVFAFLRRAYRALFPPICTHTTQEPLNGFHEN